jgi:hypothetical protein
VVERTTELRREIEDTRDHLGDTLDAIGDRVSPGRIVERRKNRVRESWTTARTRVMGAAPSPSGAKDAARDKASGVASTISDTASSIESSVSESVRHAPDAVASGTQGSPLVAGGLAFGLGLLVASLLPPTETEASVAGDIVEPLKQEATQIGKEVGSTVKDSAASAGEQAKAALTDAATTVKDEAASAAQDVKGTASDATQQVASTAQQSKDRLSG